MKDGALDPPTDAYGDTTMGEGKEGEIDDDDENDITALACGVCTKKRCEQHKQWVKVQRRHTV